MTIEELRQQAITAWNVSYPDKVASSVKARSADGMAVVHVTYEQPGKYASEVVPLPLSFYGEEAALIAFIQELERRMRLPGYDNV